MRKYTLHAFTTEFPTEVEARMSILKRKAIADRLSVPAEVLSFVAEHIPANRHELEGALTRIMAFASIVNQDVTVDLAAKALNIDIGDVSAAVRSHSHEDFASEVTSYAQADKRRRLVAFRRRVSAWYQRNTLSGVVEGILLSVLSTLALGATCLFMDVVLKHIGLLTLSVPWIWWSIIGLNALTVCIPVDVFRAHTAHFNQSAHGRVSVVTYGALELIIVSLFLVILFRLQNVDIQVMQALGLLNR